MVHLNLEERLDEIKSREIEGHWEKEELVDLLLNGIQYYQRYQADMLTWLIQVTITNKLFKLTLSLVCAGHLCGLYLSEHGKGLEGVGPDPIDQHACISPSATHPGGNAPCYLLLCLPDSPSLPPDPLLSGTCVCLAPSSLNPLQFQAVIKHLSSNESSPWHAGWISAHPRLHRRLLPGPTLAQPRPPSRHNFPCQIFGQR